MSISQDLKKAFMDRFNFYLSDCGKLFNNDESEYGWVPLTKEMEMFLKGQPSID